MQLLVLRLYHLIHRPKKKVIEKESTVDLADLCDSDEVYSI